MHPQRKAKNRILVGLGITVVTLSLAAAFFFGEKSPLIASGKIILPESMTLQAQGMRTLYIIVRDADSPMPMPWGALSITLSGEPQGEIYSFILTRENLSIMNSAAEPPKRLNIKARLDMDALGGADMPGDITGVKNDLPFGSRDVTIELSELVSEGAPVAGP